MSEIVLTPEMKETLKNAVNEMVRSKQRIEDEKAHQKEICERIKDELQGMIPVQTFKQVSDIAFKDNGREKNDKLTEVLDLAEELGHYSHNSYE